MKYTVKYVTFLKMHAEQRLKEHTLFLNSLSLSSDIMDYYFLFADFYFAIFIQAYSYCNKNKRESVKMKR